MSGTEIRGLLLGLVGVLLIGLVDLATGPDFGFAFFYFIPIVPVAWTVGRGPGLVLAVASAAMWFLADISLDPQALLPVAWNATSRLTIFVAGVLLIDRVKQDSSRMRHIDAQRDDFLRVLEHELPVPAEDMVKALGQAQGRGTLDAAAIQALRHRAEALLFLTRDFVALGQAQAERLRLRSVAVDVAQITTEVARERSDQEQVLVTVPSDGLIVMGDPDRLRQAITSSIAEVVAEAGALDYVSINVRARGSDALISVSAAMPATATRPADEQGPVRVSMRLARLLIEAMGGSLTVERASIGKGSRVTLRLPMSEPVPGAPAPAAQEARPR